jgi:hypothetical protein
LIIVFYAKEGFSVRGGTKGDKKEEKVYSRAQ